MGTKILQEWQTVLVNCALSKPGKSSTSTPRSAMGTITKDFEGLLSSGKKRYPAELISVFSPKSPTEYLLITTQKPMPGTKWEGYHTWTEVGMILHALGKGVNHRPKIDYFLAWW